MKRRELLKTASLAGISALAPRSFAARARRDWRSYTLRFEIDLGARTEAGRLWLPIPQDMPGWQRVLGFSWDGDAARVSVEHDPVYGARALVAEWTESGGRLDAVAKVSVRDREGGTGMAVPAAERELYLAPTANMPTDGIVAERATAIIEEIRDPDQQAYKIYEWIVDNTFRDPKIRGCGTGNIRAMLETGNLGGKCADINSLFVGLCRAVGIPAREVYGVRAGESKQFKCLGKTGGDVTGAQHCRAEYLSPARGWVPIDAADVRKVVLEERLALDDPKVKALRERLFGYWEMNWVAFNTARDFSPPPGTLAPLPYLMYPYAELGDSVLDGRDPSEFVYRIHSAEDIG